MSIKIFDTIGREVVELVNEVKESGTYSIQFDAAKLPSGMYFYQIMAGKYSSTKKLLLLR